MAEPGYYKVKYAAIRLCELRSSFRWFLSIPLWLAFRLVRMSRGGTWMPVLWNDGECKLADLSNDFLEATKQHRADFEKLGFTQCRLVKPPKSLEPIVRDHASIYYLDSTGRCFGLLTYIRVYDAVRRKEFNRIRLSLTAVFGDGTLTCVNRSATFDPRESGKVISVNSSDVPRIYKRFDEELQRCPEAPRTFPDMESLRQWFDARAVRSLDDCVRRRLFVRLTEQEVVDARAKSGRNELSFLLLRLFSSLLRLALLTAVLVFMLKVLLILNQKLHSQIPKRIGLDVNSIYYQGQKFKLSRPYTGLDVYNNPPYDLDTNELPRIEQTMEAVKIPATFKDFNEFIDFTAILSFPGYGLSNRSGKTDDGSELDVVCTEIPQANKERVVTVRGKSNGTWNLVDDFIYPGYDTNGVMRTQLENRQLEYFDQDGRLVRKKPI